MWIANLGSCAIHMDNNPHPYPQFPKETPQSDHHRINDEHHSDISEKERPKKRTRPIVDSSTTCAPEILHCRYANKKCLNLRAVKRSGGLHTFCAVHRANANRNQRRLDLRKRMARQAMRMLQKKGPLSPIHNVSALLQPTESMTSVTVSVPSDSSGYVDDRYEPLQSPTPLQEEDIATLVSLFLPP